MAKSSIWGAETPKPIATSVPAGCHPGRNHACQFWWVLVLRWVEFWPLPLTCFGAIKTLRVCDDTATATAFKSQKYTSPGRITV